MWTTYLSLGLLESSWCIFYAGINVKFKIAKCRCIYVGECLDVWWLHKDVLGCGDTVNTPKDS